MRMKKNQHIHKCNDECQMNQKETIERLFLSKILYVCYKAIKTSEKVSYVRDWKKGNVMFCDEMNRNENVEKEACSEKETESLVYSTDDGKLYLESVDKEEKVGNVFDKPEEKSEGNDSLSEEESWKMFNVNANDKKPAEESGEANIIDNDNVHRNNSKDEMKCDEAETSKTRETEKVMTCGLKSASDVKS